MRRYLSIWLPHWPTDRWQRRHGARDDAPFALISAGRRGIRLTALDARAAAEGLAPDMPLADARALVPSLRVAAADPQADIAALGVLADWCAELFTPWAAVDAPDGVMLDITGCGQLFDGEAGLVGDLAARLARGAIGLRAAVADTPGAAWAMARHGKGGIAPPEQAEAAIAPLPVAGLRLPAETVARLDKLGLARIDQILALPRASLARRFGAVLVNRLEQALGEVAEPIGPRTFVAPWRERLTFAEPLAERPALDAALERLLDRLCLRLIQAGRSARVLELTLCRIDGSVQRVRVGTARPICQTDHLLRLFAQKMEGVDPGFGIEAMILRAPETQKRYPAQLALDARRQRAADDRGRLIDRLVSRHGARALHRIAPFESHLPERAMALRPIETPTGAGDWTATQPRPVRLLRIPEPIDAVAPLPDFPPARFRWRGEDHRIHRAEGPERIAPEWWLEQDGGGVRDYYRVEDVAGRRFWVYREGLCGETAAGKGGPRWFMHGLFA
jgi:protein ImuB